MNPTKRIMRNAAILVGVFLIGLLPPLFRNIQLKNQLAAAQARIDLAETRELAALSYLEVSKNNFGVAAQHASQLFGRLGTLSTSAEEPVRAAATRAVQKRDALMGMLATADPGARNELQEMLGQLLFTDNESAARSRTR